MRIRFTDTALTELDEILSYISLDNPNAADRVGDAIARTIEWIGENPLMSPVVHSKNIRSKLVVGFQYRVYYIVDPDEVVIRNIRSTRRLRPWED